MQKREMNNQELDAIGKRLFAASRLTEAEIDRIASGPELFHGVRRRISDQARNGSASASRFSISRLAFGSSLAGFLFLGVFAIYLQQNQFDHVNNSGSVFGPDQARVELTPQVRIVKGFTQARATFLDEINSPETPQIENAVQREIRRPQPRVQRASYTDSQENDFVAVTYVGEGAESTRGGRVVRVDVPRSTLFAMGFNVSLENDSATVKADLLIGPDGVTRAVRLVE